MPGALVKMPEDVDLEAVNELGVELDHCLAILNDLQVNEYLDLGTKHAQALSWYLSRTRQNLEVCCNLLGGPV